MACLTRIYIYLYIYTVSIVLFWLNLKTNKLIKKVLTVINNKFSCVKILICYLMVTHCSCDQEMKIEKKIKVKK